MNLTHDQRLTLQRFQMMHQHRPTLNTLKLSSLALAIGLSCSTAHAARIEVNNSVDKVLADSADGLCSFRDALLSVTLQSFNIAGPNGDQPVGCSQSSTGTLGVNDQVEFSAPLDNTTIAISVPDLGLPLGRAMSVNADGRNITINMNKTSRHFNAAGGASEPVTLNNLTLIGGLVDGAGQNFGSALGVFLDTTVTITNSTILGNTAAQSAAFWIADEGSKLILEDSVVRDNVGLGGNAFGGAILLNLGADMEIRRSVISRNQVTGRGGAIAMGFNEGDSIVDIEDSTISDNTATIAGGIDLFSGTLTLENSTISGNQASAIGGIFVSETTAEQSKLIMKNTTVAFNSSNTVGGLNIEGSAEVEVANSIFSNSSGNVAYNDNCAKDAINAIVTGDINSIVQNNQSCLFGTDVDAGLRGLSQNGGSTSTHALRLNSAAANTGNNATCLATDQRGGVRPLSPSDQCDVGAFEQTEQDRKKLAGGFTVLPLGGKKVVVIPN